MTRIILATDKANVPPLFKAISLEYPKQLSFAVVKSTETEIVSSLGVSNFPTIMVLQNGKEPFPYKGDMKPKTLIEFLDTLVDKPTKKAEKKEEKKEAEAEPCRKVFILSCRGAVASQNSTRVRI